MRRSQQMHHRLWATLVSDEVTSPQFSVLLALKAIPDADQQTIGKAAYLDRSTVAEVVERMVRRGYLDRKRDPRDQRRNVLRLSASGESLVDELLPATRTLNETMLDVLNDSECEAFVALLTKFVAGLESATQAE